MSFISVFKKEVVDGFKQSKWLPLITACAVLSAIIGPGLHIPLLHLLFIAIGLLLFFTKKTKIEKSALWLLLYLPINLLITNPDKIFSSWTRLGLFAAVFIFTAPILTGHYVGNFRKKLLMGILLICVILGIGSFACYFLGINYMSNQFDGSAINDFQGGSGGFGGLMFQSISLGMVSGMGMLYLFYRLLLQQKKDRIWYYIPIVIIALTILIASSRSALLSAMAGVLMMIYQKNKRNGRFIQVIMGLLLVGILTSPLWENFTVGFESKSLKNAELGAYGSRTQKWTARITEFSSSPIVGIGFASVDNRLDDVGVGGVVEPGSSWLCILSMTGIIGFILVVIILIKPFKYVKSHPTPYNTLLFGLMVFISTHMIFEGYIFAGGSALCFMAWLIFGCCNDARYATD